jgi:DNA-binding CsgD family transcriptional regulator
MYKPLSLYLTDRERENLLLIAQGYNNGDIARRLTLSLKTVANHVSNIFSKLQVADRAQAIIRAREAGWSQDRSYLLPGQGVNCGHERFTIVMYNKAKDAIS